MRLLARLVARVVYELDVARGLNAEAKSIKQPRASLQFHEGAAGRPPLGEALRYDDIADIDEWGHAG